MAKIIKRNSYKALAIILAASMFGFYFSLIDRAQANQVSSRSDTMTNSNFTSGTETATSNHTIVFTVQDSIDRTCSDCSASDTVVITMPSGFDMTTIDCGDVDVSTGTQFALNTAGDTTNATDCRNTATSWGLVISGQVITLTAPSSVMTFVATGTTLTIQVGSNATFQNTGNEWIKNPAGASPPTSPPAYYTISISGTFGGTGNINIGLLQAVEVSATIAETLTIAMAGMAGISGTNGANLMSVCGNNLASPSADDDDLESVTFVTTTATTVPFGTVNTGTVYEGCQKLSISTNAGNGYTVRTRENHAMRTPGALEIPDANCDSDGCLNTPSTARPFTLSGSGVGLGITCSNSATSQSCSTSEPLFGCASCATISGTSWAPIANETRNTAAGTPQTPAKFSNVSGVTSVEVITKVKYRLEPPLSQGAGTYSNLVSFIATPVY